MSENHESGSTDTAKTARQIQLSSSDPAVLRRLVQAASGPTLAIQNDERTVSLTCTGSWQLPLLIALQVLLHPERRKISVTVTGDDGLSTVHDAAELHDAVSERWIDDLLQRNAMTTLFQPIVKGKDNVFAHECLLRGLGPDGKLIPPQHMFDAARTANLLSKLDGLAQQSGIDRIAATNSGPDARFFIKVIPSSILEPGYSPSTLIEAVEKAGLSTKQLCIEFREERGLLGDKTVLKAVNTFRDAGFQICLGGVGGTDGPLYRISDLRPHFAKLNGDFVRRAVTERIEGRILTDMTRTFFDAGIDVIAAGVETHEHFNFITAAGITTIQGYFWGRPALRPLSAFSTFSADLVFS